MKIVEANYKNVNKKRVWHMASRKQLKFDTGYVVQQTLKNITAVAAYEDHVYYLFPGKINAYSISTKKAKTLNLPDNPIVVSIRIDPIYRILFLICKFVSLFFESIFFYKKM